MKALLTFIAPLALASVTAGQDITVDRAGSQPPQQGPAENFTGTVRVERLFGAAGPGRATGGLVSFEAGARSAWHKHPLGQPYRHSRHRPRAAVGQRGSGNPQRRHGAHPVNVKHWHGASPASSMSHIAIYEQLEGKAVEWMEKVSDADLTSRCQASHRRPHRRAPEEHVVSEFSELASFSIS